MFSRKLKSHWSGPFTITQVFPYGTVELSQNSGPNFKVRNQSRFEINKWYQSLALRNFDLEDMELESTNSGPTAKLLILKLGEYEMWAIRIKQYFQIQDYALWEVIENGDSWAPISQTTKGNGITTLKMSTPTTAEEKIKKKNDVKAMMEADRLLAKRLQSKEREELTYEEKAKLFMEQIEKRRKHFATFITQEKRNRPPTKAQKRTQMSTYLKHMGGYTYKQLKGKSFDEIQKLFDKEIKRVNTFVAMGSEVHESKEKKEEGREETAEGSRMKMLGRKRAVKEQQKESSKKLKVEEEKESKEVE
ncbi:hypothetical protein Tco_1477478, partial [Tanacetum coccineum]